MNRPATPLAVVASFIDCINRGDLDGLAALMSEDHRLVVLNEEPLRGRTVNVDAWKAYFSSFPDYVIFRRQTAAQGSRVAVLGTTTGSHLGLPAEEEMKISVIWLAEVVDGRLWEWRIAEDTPELRIDVGIPASA